LHDAQRFGTTAVVNRPDVQAMIEKIDFDVHPEAEAAGYDTMTTIIDIDLVDGRTASGRADFAKGSPSKPMTDAELEATVRECAAWGGMHGLRPAASETASTASRRARSMRAA
jgi:2-methylcitrate dehydratase PrpD